MSWFNEKCWVKTLVEIDDHEEWKVEEILDFEIKRNKLSYFVDWIEYFIDERFWESALYFANVIDVVSRYHIRYLLRLSLKDFKPINRRRWLVSQELDREERHIVMNASARTKFIERGSGSSSTKRARTMIRTVSGLCDCFSSL